MEKALKTLQKTLPFFRQAISEEEQGPEVIRPLQMMAVALYRKEKEMIRPGVMLILESESPVIPGYDHKKEATKQGYGGVLPQGLLAKWAAQRNATIAVLSNLSEEQLARIGVTPDGEKVTIKKFVQRWAEGEKETIIKLREG